MITLVMRLLTAADVAVTAVVDRVIDAAVDVLIAGWEHGDE